MAESVSAVRQSTISADHSMRVDQRAWIGLLDIKIVQFLSAGQDFVVRVSIKNTGKTPATDVIFHARLQAISKGAVPNYSYGDTGGSGMMLPQSIGTHEIGMGHPVPADTSRALARGERTMFLHGRIEYKDIFGDEHWTNWCYYLEGYGLETFTAYKEHNDTDDQKV